jgi:hypothetical protein
MTFEQCEMKTKVNRSLNSSRNPWFAKSANIFFSDITLVCNAFKGGHTAILVHWSNAQRTTEMLADWKK